MKQAQVPFDLQTMEVSPEFRIGPSLDEMIMASEVMSLIRAVTMRPIRAAFLFTCEDRSEAETIQIEGRDLALDDTGFVYDKNDGTTVGLANWLDYRDNLLVRLYM